MTAARSTSTCFLRFTDSGKVKTYTNGKNRSQEKIMEDMKKMKQKKSTKKTGSKKVKKTNKAKKVKAAASGSWTKIFDKEVSQETKQKAIDQLIKEGMEKDKAGKLIRRVLRKDYPEQYAKMKGTAAPKPKKEKAEKKEKSGKRKKGKLTEEERKEAKKKAPAFTPRKPIEEQFDDFMDEGKEEKKAGKKSDPKKPEKKASAKKGKKQEKKSGKKAPAKKPEKKKADTKKKEAPAAKVVKAKSLGRHLYTMIKMSVKVCGSFNPAEVLPYIEEELTGKEYSIIESFLTWVHAEGLAFGSGNYEKVYKAFLAAHSGDQKPEKKESKSPIEDIWTRKGAATFVQRMSYLFSRWQDESEYEDFKEYAAEMKKAFAKLYPKGAFVKGTQSPFGFQFKLAKEKFKVIMKVKGGQVNMTAQTV